MTTQHKEPSRTENAQLAALWRRVRAGDEEGWKELEPMCEALIEQWTRRAGLQPADREDVSQDVLIALLCKASEFDERLGEESFRAWVWTITEHKIKDVRRARRRHPTIQINMETIPALAATEPGEPAEPSSAATEAVAAIERVRSVFHPKTFEAFWQTVVEDRLAKAVAEELQMAVASVYQAKHRVLAKVQEELVGGPAQTPYPMPALGFEIFYPNAAPRLAHPPSPRSGFKCQRHAMYL